MNSRSDVVPGDTYPTLCINVGLSCETCVSTTARDLALVCKGLQGPMISRTFVHIYPDAACSPMVTYFGNCYTKASQAMRKSVVAEMPVPTPVLPIPVMKEEQPVLYPQVMASVA